MGQRVARVRRQLKGRGPLRACWHAGGGEELAEGGVGHEDLARLAKHVADDLLVLLDVGIRGAAGGVNRWKMMLLERRQRTAVECNVESGAAGVGDL
eukprot:scaffold31508_cov21-Phaeocystis_antarctica.AAC.1